MQQQDDRDQTTQPERDETRPPQQVEPQAETQLDEELVRSGGGPRYQEGHRQPGDTDAGAPRSSASTEAADLHQRGQEYGGPNPAEEETLHQQGYPKLGRKLPSKVTQVEHGPYAGGSQQGDTKSENG